MSKAVLISIQPKWCELIASGKKTVEVRKTKPKLDTPFKCYIYCTKESYKGNYLHTSNQHGKLLFWHNQNDTTITVQPEEYDYTAYTCSGKVVGEFVCDKIFPISVYYDNPNCKLALKEFPYVCLTDKQIIDYLGNGKQGYGLHISGLVIYDKPKDLSEFYHKCEKTPCEGCEHLKYQKVNSQERDWDCEYLNYQIPITRPPQSWCYVEELSV